jgi:hypothetical protein
LLYLRSQELAVFASDCPQCHDRRTLEIVSVTPFHVWIHCQSCGHLWNRSPLGYAIARFMTSLREGPPPIAPSVEDPEEVPPAADAGPMLLMEDLPDARRACTVEDIEAWLRQGDGEVVPRAHTPDDVSNWIEHDPFGAKEEPVRREVVNEELFLPPPGPVRPMPATLAERLDAFHDGLVRLEEFVANCTRREEAEAQRMMAEIEAAAASRAAARKKAPVLRFKAS